METTASRNRTEHWRCCRRNTRKLTDHNSATNSAPCLRRLSVVRGRAHHLLYERLHFSATLWLGGRAQANRACSGVPHIPEKKLHSSAAAFKKYTHGVLSQMKSFHVAMAVLAVKDEQYEPNLMTHCTEGEPRLEQTRSRISEFIVQTKLVISIHL